MVISALRFRTPLTPSIYGGRLPYTRARKHVSEEKAKAGQYLAMSFDFSSITYVLDLGGPRGVGAGLEIWAPTARV